MKIRESICLLKQDRARSGFSKWRYFYDPIMAQLLFFRLSDCSNKLLRLYSRFRLKRLSYRTGIQLTAGTEMGGGIKIVHHGNIVITKGAIIGKNLTLHQGVTIGKNFGGKRYGYPTIGDNVIIFPNSVVVGRITIGSNVIIGAGSVVINDVPDNCVVAGNPAKIVSEDFQKAITDKEWKLYFRLP